MTGSIARRYAKAIFSIAQEENEIERIGNELQQLAAIAGEPDVSRALANPLLPAAARSAIARTLADQLHLRPSTRNFVCLLADQRRLDQLAGIADHYQKLLDRAANRVRARVISAVPLDEAQIRATVAAFEKSTRRTVVAQTVVDPALLGGVLVEVEGKVYDGSVRTQLERLAATIAGGRGHL